MALPNHTQTTIVRPPTKRTWWKESSVYQIYPSSFKASPDSTTGLGDLRGIISELDYITKLGVDIVWLSPILASPQVDMGYDISNYKDIDPQFGTMADHDDLIAGLHKRGMKYVLDLVVNHTSDEHEWFKQSRSSKSNPYREWYFWRPAKGVDKDGNRIPPNNWRSCFSGSAWEWDETTQEYYLHLFAKQQPDLNWENSKVIEAVHDVVRFWLDRGVDGFRMDVINFISKEYGLPDAPITVPGQFLQWGSDLYACGPRLHEFFRGLGKIMEEYDAFNVGEMPAVFDTAEILKAVGQDRGELQMCFNFEIVDMDGGEGDKFKRRDWKLSELKTIVSKWQTFMIDNGGWNALYMENHDQGRSISRYASHATPELRVASAKMLATYLGLMSGTVFIYQGQELAQVNMPREWGMDRYRDIECLNHWKDLLEKHADDKELQKATLREYWLKCRDNARTPMQWNASPNAGFCTDGVKPWIDVHDDYKEWNAEKQKDDPDSPYTYWSQLLSLRKKHKDVFVYGDFQMVDMPNPDIFAYVRSEVEGSRKALVVTNFTDREVEWKVADHLAAGGKATVELTNYADGPKNSCEQGTFTIRPFEAFVAMVG